MRNFYLKKLDNIFYNTVAEYTCLLFWGDSGLTRQDWWRNIVCSREWRVACCECCLYQLRIMSTLPETNIAMENPQFWWYLQGKMGFSWAMLVSGRVIIIDFDIIVKQVLRQIETSNLRRSDRFNCPKSSDSKYWGCHPRAKYQGPNYQKLAF